jgi:hypothetical protein
VHASVDPVAIVSERRRERQVVGALQDRDVDAEPAQKCMQLLVEGGHGEPVGELE